MASRTWHGLGVHYFSDRISYPEPQALRPSLVPIALMGLCGEVPIFSHIIIWNILAIRVNDNGGMPWYVSECATSCRLIDIRVPLPHSLATKPYCTRTPLKFRIRYRTTVTHRISQAESGWSPSPDTYSPGGCECQPPELSPCSPVARCV